jgi:uncharacterized membrane protein (DUF485 family)
MLLGFAFFIGTPLLATLINEGSPLGKVLMFVWGWVFTGFIIYEFL